VEQGVLAVHDEVELSVDQILLPEVVPRLMHLIPVLLLEVLHFRRVAIFFKPAAILPISEIGGTDPLHPVGLYATQPVGHLLVVGFI